MVRADLSGRQRSGRAGLLHGLTPLSANVGSAFGTTAREAGLPCAGLRCGRLLCTELDCRNDHLSFGVSEHGKPFARIRGLEAPISFNVSHSGVHGLIAVSPRGRIGVDVEEPTSRRNLDLLIEVCIDTR